MGIKAGEVIWDILPDLSKLEQGLSRAYTMVKKGTDSAVKKLADIGPGLTKIGAVITGAFIAAGAGAIAAADEVNQAVGKMEAALSIPHQRALEFGEMLKEVYGNNFGDSIEDVGQSITDVSQALESAGGVADAALKQATEAAIALRDTFEYDVKESAGAAAALMRDFGLTSKEAFEFIAYGSQRGLDASGDFLDTIGEYSTQFANAGADASMFFSLLETGMANGMLGTDKAADLMKEFRVRILDGSKATGEGLDKLGIKQKEFLGNLASGQMTTADAFQLVIEKLRGVTDQGVLMQTGVALMGTQFEDLGQKAVLSMDLTTGSLANASGAIDQLNAQYNNFGSALEGLRRKFVLALEPIGQELLKVINEHMPQISKAFDDLKTVAPALGEVFAQALDLIADKIVPVVTGLVEWSAANPELVATLAAVTGAIGVIASVLGPLFIAIKTIVASWGLVTGAVAAAGGAFTGLGGIIAAVASAIGTAIGAIVAAVGAPVLLIIAAVAALGAAVWYWWDEIKAQFLWGAQTAGDILMWFWEGTKSVLGGIVDAFDWAVGAVTGAWDWMIGVIKTGIEWVKEGLAWAGKIGGFMANPGGAVWNFANGAMSMTAPVANMAAANSNLSGASGGSGAGAVNNNLGGITINVQAGNGTNPDELADTIWRVFEGRLQAAGYSV